jgi:hypothetical protein
MSGNAAHTDSRKGDTPSVCEREGLNAPVREKEQSAGEKKKKKMVNLTRVDSRKEETPYSHFLARGALCTCKKRGTVMG